MSDSTRVVSVYTSDGEGAAVDLTLPARIPLSALLPDIVDVTLGGGSAPGRHWRLCRVGGAALDGQRTLTDQDVHDGDLLLLDHAGADVPRFDRYDWSTCVIAQQPVSPSSPRTRALSGSAAALCGTLLCALTTATGPLAAAIVATLCCGAASTAVWASRSRSGSGAAGPLAVLTVALAAVCGARVVPGDLSAAHALLAGTAATAVSLALLRFHVGGISGLMALTCTGTVAAGSALAAVSLSLPTASTGAVLALLALGALGGSPRMSILLSGLGRAAIDIDPSPDADERAVAGHRILAGLVVGGASAAALGVVAVAAATLHRTGPWAAAAAYCAAVGIVLVLRARTFASGHCRRSLMAGGICCLAACSAVILTAVPQHAHWAGALAVCAGVATIMRDEPGEVSPVAARAVDIVEYLTIAAVAPLACAVLGLFGTVRDLALT